MDQHYCHGLSISTLNDVLDAERCIVYCMDPILKVMLGSNLFYDNAFMNSVQSSKKSSIYSLSKCIFIVKSYFSGLLT